MDVLTRGFSLDSATVLLRHKTHLPHRSNTAATYSVMLYDCQRFHENQNKIVLNHFMFQKSEPMRAL